MGASVEDMVAQLHAAVRGTEPGVAAASELCRVCLDLFGIDGAAVSTVHDGAAQWTFGASDEPSRRLDEHQFTFGEGPCIDAVATRRAVLVPDLGSSGEHRWPAFAEAALADGVRGVFALPILVAARPVGALDLFRATPGPLPADALAGALVAAELAALSLLDLVAPDVFGRDGERRAHELDAAAPADAGDHSDEMDMRRVEVYQATGMLIHQLDLSPAHAVARLRAHAMATGRTASQVAFDIIERRLTLARDDERDGPGYSEGS